MLLRGGGDGGGGAPFGGGTGNVCACAGVIVFCGVLWGNRGVAGVLSGAGWGSGGHIVASGVRCDESGHVPGGVDCRRSGNGCWGCCGCIRRCRSRCGFFSCTCCSYICSYGRSISCL